MRPSLTRLLLCGSLCTVGLLSLIGATPARAQAAKSGSNPPGPSRIDIFAGYSYLDPYHSDINNYRYQPVRLGAVGSVTGYFNRYFGIEAEGSFAPQTSTDCVVTAEAGPVLRYPLGRFVPFFHGVAGRAKVGGPQQQPCTWGLGITSGIGLDYTVPGFGNQLAIRPIQADYFYSEVDNGPLVLPKGLAGGFGEIIGYRLSGGVVLRFGEIQPPAPLQLGCTANPVDIFPGDPVAITASTLNLSGRRRAIYTWSSSGGQITGSDTTATVATTGLAPGDYTVSGRLSQGGAFSQQASCSAGFRVQGYQPPTIACSANPGMLMPGETSSTITAAARSPQNRILSYSYSASAGQVTGTAGTATLSTAGAPPGAVTVTCNVVDDLGQQSSATASVTISAPPPPVAPATRRLCSLSFERDRKRPARVDNEAKGCLDEIALTLNRESGAKLVIVGRHDAGETSEAAAERTLNVQQYLTAEKGVEASRINLRTGDGSGRAVDTMLIPAGSSFDPTGTGSFDAGSIPRHGQPYGRGAQPRPKGNRGSAR